MPGGDIIARARGRPLLSSHQDIRPFHLWSAMGYMALRRGITPPELEPPTNLSARSEETASWPSLETIFSVLRATGSDLHEFGEIVDRLAAAGGTGFA